MAGEKTVGIIGGMGPDATVDLMRRILLLTPALDDVDHIHCLVDNNPKVPSRIKAILEGTGESPGPCLAHMAARLEQWGADLLAMPCNTAHHYLEEIQAAVRIPMLDIIAVTLAAVRNALGPTAAGRAQPVGLLASPAVRITRLYEKKASDFGMTIIYPEEDKQEQIFQLIKQVKAGRRGPDMGETLAEVVDALAARGAEAAVIACTELGVVAGEKFSLPVFDSSEELAGEIVRLAGPGNSR